MRYKWHTVDEMTQTVREKICHVEVLTLMVLLVKFFEVWLVRLRGGFRLVIGLFLRGFSLSGCFWLFEEVERVVHSCE